MVGFRPDEWVVAGFAPGWAAAFLEPNRPREAAPAKVLERKLLRRIVFYS